MKSKLMGSRRGTHTKVSNYSCYKECTNYKNFYGHMRHIHCCGYLQQSPTMIFLQGTCQKSWYKIGTHPHVKPLRKLVCFLYRQIYHGSKGTVAWGYSLLGNFWTRSGKTFTRMIEIFFGGDIYGMFWIFVGMVWNFAEWLGMFWNASRSLPQGHSLSVDKNIL